MKNDYPTEALCEAFCVSRSGFYDWLERRSNPSARAKEDEQLAQQISEVHQQSRGTYGTPRLHAELRDRGHKHSRKRIDRLRRELGLSGRAKRRYRPQTTDSCHEEPIAPNRLAQLPKASRRDQIWVSDITYIPTQEGWLYLAVIMDLYSRRIIGWALAHHLGTELVAAALAMALVHRRPPEGLIHHSDRGVQYASAAYRQALKAHGVVASISRKGCCYDNAAMEAFFSTLKVECVYRSCFATHRSAQREIFCFIVRYSGRRRQGKSISRRECDCFFQVFRHFPLSAWPKGGSKSET